MPAIRSSRTDHFGAKESSRTAHFCAKELLNFLVNPFFLSKSGTLQECRFCPFLLWIAANVRFAEIWYQLERAHNQDRDRPEDGQVGCGVVLRCVGCGVVLCQITGDSPCLFTGSGPKSQNPAGQPGHHKTQPRAIDSALTQCILRRCGFGGFCGRISE